MNHPLVSIIVPVYNAHDYLSRCVESLLNQSYTHIEIILVDDGSTDGSGALCDTYTTDSRVRVVHKENGGLPSARNAGLDVAWGDYLVFIDSDDYVHPQMIEILLHALTESHTELSICSFSYVSDTAPQTSAPSYDLAGEVSRYSSMVQTDDLYQLLFHANYGICMAYIVAWNKMFSRSLIGDSQFMDGTGEDLRFNATVYKDCPAAVYVDLPLYSYVQRTSSLMHTRKAIVLRDLHVYYYIYQHILKELPRYAALCLAKIYKQFVHGLLMYRGTDYETPLRAFFKEVKRDTWLLWLHDRNNSLFQKAHFLLFWHCPCLYSFCINRLLPLLRRLRR